MSHMSMSTWVLLAAWLAAATCASALQHGSLGSDQPRQTIGAPPYYTAALLALSASLCPLSSNCTPTWQPASDPCQDWEGVGCAQPPEGGTPQVVSVELRLPAEQLVLDAAALGVGSGAPLLPTLQELSLTCTGPVAHPGPGPLTHTWLEALPRLAYLRVAGCGISGTLDQLLGTANDPVRQQDHAPAALCSGNSSSKLCSWRRQGQGPGAGRRLESLSLPHNALTGPLPPGFLAALPVLGLLDLSSNGLTGPLPPVWAPRDTSLRYLYLGDNALSGPLPCSWSLWSTLELADLSANPDLGSPHTSLSTTPGATLDVNSSSSSSRRLGKSVLAGVGPGGQVVPRCWMRRWCVREGSFICMERSSAQPPQGLHQHPQQPPQQQQQAGYITGFAPLAEAVQQASSSQQSSQDRGGMQPVAYSSGELSDSGMRSSAQQQQGHLQQLHPLYWQHQQQHQQHQQLGGVAGGITYCTRFIRGDSEGSRNPCNMCQHATGADVALLLVLWSVFLVLLVWLWVAACARDRRRAAELEAAEAAEAAAAAAMSEQVEPWGPSSSSPSSPLRQPLLPGGSPRRIRAGLPPSRDAAASPSDLLPSALAAPPRPTQPPGSTAAARGAGAGASPNSKHGSPAPVHTAGASTHRSGEGRRHTPPPVTTWPGPQPRVGGSGTGSGQLLSPTSSGALPLSPTLSTAAAGGSWGQGLSWAAPAMWLPPGVLLLDTLFSARLLAAWGLTPWWPARWPTAVLAGLLVAPHVAVGLVVHLRLVAAACLPGPLAAASPRHSRGDLPPGAAAVIGMYTWVAAAPAWVAYPLLLLLMVPGVVVVMLVCPLAPLGHLVGLVSTSATRRYLALLQAAAAVTSAPGCAMLLSVLWILGNTPLTYSYLDSTLMVVVMGGNMADMAVAWATALDWF